MKDSWHSIEEKPEKEKTFLYQTSFNGFGLNQVSDKKDLVIKYDLDISHYKYTNDMKYNSHFVSKNPKDILSELVSKGEREYKCELCGLTTIWNNKPLIL